MTGPRVLHGVICGVDLAAIPADHHSTALRGRYPVEVAVDEQPAGAGLLSEVIIVDRAHYERLTAEAGGDVHGDTGGASPEARCVVRGGVADPNRTLRGNPMTTADPTPEPIVVGDWTFTRDGDDVLVGHPVRVNKLRSLQDTALAALFSELERLRSEAAWLRACLYGHGYGAMPDGALCWDPYGPGGGAWVLRGRDVPDGWRWWWRDPDSGVRTPGVPDGLYWALPPDEPSTERVPWWMAIGRTPDHCPNDRIIEVGLDGDGPWFCTGPSIEPECRDYAVEADGTVTVLVEDDDQ